MKRFLLLITMVLTLAAWVKAEVVTVDYTTRTPDPTETIKDANGKAILTIAYDTNRRDSGHVRVYGGKTITFTAEAGVTLEKIVISTTTAEKLTSANVSAGSYDADTQTWVGSTNSLVITNTKSSQARVTGYVITYSVNTKEAAGLSFTSAEVTAYLGSIEPFKGQTVNNPHEIDGVQYTSSHPEVASVNSETGAVEILTAGKTTITATTPSTEVYNKGTADYVLNVLDPNESAPEGYYLLKNITDLYDGAKVLIVNSDNKVSIKNSPNKNNFPQTAVTIENEFIGVISEDVAIFEVASNAEGKYCFKITNCSVSGQNNYYLNPQFGQNYLKLQEAPAYATISLTETDNADIYFTNQSATETRYVRYNKASSLFSCYKSGQEPVQIYIEQKGEPVTPPEAPEVKINGESVNSTDISIETGKTVEITFPEIIGGAVYYKFVADTAPQSMTAEETEGYKKYTEPITIDKAGVLTYVAEVNGLQSEPKSITFKMTTTGIENVVVDGEGEVEYFNLQGVRVANPTNGIFIRRQGSTVTKVAIR